MNKKIRSFSKEYQLDPASIDEISDQLDSSLEDFGSDWRNRLRIRLSIEEALLRMRDHFGESAKVRLEMGSRFKRSFIQIRHEGDIYNPLSKTEVDLQDWCGAMLTSFGMYPQYSYSRGENTLRLNLPIRGMNQALKLLIALAVGGLLGLICTVLMPDGVQAVLLNNILFPIYEMWLRILSVISGPVIFFMVMTTVLNTGSIEEVGGSSLRVSIRYMGISFAVAAAAVLVALAVIRIPVIMGETFGVKTSEYLERILHIIPEDALSPLIEANTPQILLIAFILGNCLVVLGDRGHGLRSIVRQCNMVGLLLAEWISRCVPYFAAMLVFYVIMQGHSGDFGQVATILLLAIAFSILCIYVIVQYVSIRTGVPLPVLVRKVWPPFIKAIRTGRLDDGFGETEHCCSNKLGIEKHYTEVSLTHGLLLYMPFSIIGTLLFTIFAACQYQDSLSLGWLIIAGTLSVVMVVAAPPVPGSSLLAYIMIFDLLGIPNIALIGAMNFDLLYGIFAAAANQTALQMDLVLQADRIALLDRETLRRR